MKILINFYVDARHVTVYIYFKYTFCNFLNLSWAAHQCHNLQTG